MAVCTICWVELVGVKSLSSAMFQYWGRSSRKWLVSMKTQTVWATDSCFLSFSAQRAAKLEMLVRRASISVTMPGNEREVQILFFFDISSMGMQSSPFNSFHVRMATTLFSVARTHESAWLAKSRAVLIPNACRRAA
jgi:hypothetical protein